MKSTQMKRAPRAAPRTDDQRRAKGTLLQVARAKLLELGDFGHLVVRWHGEHMVIEHPGPPDDPEDRDAVLRLTPLGGFNFGLSLRRHTGRWEKLPVSGLLAGVLVDAVQMLGPWLSGR
jgi:hypothetical protein